MTDEKENPEACEAGASRRPWWGWILRHPVLIVLAGILAAAGIALGGMIWFRPHALSSLLWSVYREPSSETTTPGEPAGMDGSESLLPVLALVHVDRRLGFSRDDASVLLQMYTEGFQGTDLGVPRHWLWRVSVSDGRIEALNEGDLSAAVGWDGKALFLEQPPVRSGLGSVPRWLPPVLTLRLVDQRGTMKRIAEGDLDTRWFGFSPDGTKGFYHRRDDSGVHVELVDFESGAQREWTAKDSKPIGGAAGEPKGSEARVVAWLAGGKSLLRMVRSPVEVAGKGRGWAVLRFEVGSVETGEILESVPGVKDRLWVSGPDYNGAGFFTLVTRKRGVPDFPWNNRVDLFGISPLRPIASFPGDSVFWSPDGKLAEIEKPDEGRRLYSGIIGIYRAGRDSVQEVKIRDMNPPLDRVLPYSFSPDSTKLLAASYRVPRLAILDLATLSPVRVVEGVDALEGSWSPGGRYAALVARRAESEIAGPYILDTSNGNLRGLNLPLMRPLGWLDARTALFINRWVGQETEQAGPLRIARVDSVTGKTQIIPLR